MPWVLAAGVVLGAVILFSPGKKAAAVLDKAGVLGKLALAAQTVKAAGADLTLAVTQAVEESNWGQSELAVKSNNLFGIKAEGSWTGPADDYPTKEWSSTIRDYVTVHAYFRRYASWQQSFEDWYQLLHLPLYSRALAALVQGDGPTFYEELENAGYSTDPQYAANLGRVQSDVAGLLGATT